MKKNDLIYIAGHNGLVGSAILRLLKDEGYSNIITRSSKELDLRNQLQAEEFFNNYKPKFIFLAAATVGGIQANINSPADFIYDNLMISTNVIHAAYKTNCHKLLNLGSSCIYPKITAQPISEDQLLSDKLEPTNEAYAIAKIAGIKLCQSYFKQHNCQFISAMPTNLYGANDNYDLENSHVIPALLKKFHLAKVNKSKEVVVWGSGNPKREFLHVDDLAEACLFLMRHYQSEDIINVGTGKEISIKELAYLIKEITNFKGKISFDTSKPDGTILKKLNVSKINKLGWKAKIDLKKGLQSTYNKEFLN